MLQRLGHRVAERVAMLIGVGMATSLAALIFVSGGLAGATPVPVRTATGAGAITYQADTVVVPRAVVSAELVGIAPGGVYTFKSATGALAQLTPGKVMVLEGSGAGVVTAAATKSGQLIVHTKDATLGQIIRSGTIAYGAAPDFGQAFAAPIDLADDGLSASRVPDVRPADAGTLAIQGGSGPWGYSITGSVKGPHELDISGTVCLGYNGTECGNGPARAVAVEIGISGTLDLNKLNGDIQVADGTVKKLSAAFDGLKSQLKMNYTFSRGEGDVQTKFPPIHIPIGWDIPIPNPYVPLFARIQFSALLQVLSKPGKNTVSHGASSTSIDGNATAGDADGTTAGGAGADSGSGEVDAGDQGLGISLAPLGVDVTFQEKVGVGLGVSVANLMGFTDVTDTIGQEQASAIAGGFCSSYIGVLDWGVGLGAEFGGSVVGAQLTKRWSLVKKNYFFTEPGCRPLSA